MDRRFEGEFNSPTAATVWLILALAIFVVLSEVSIWATFIELDLWEESIARGSIVGHEAVANQQRRALVDGFHLFFFVVSGMLLFRWLNLVARNARALGAVGMRFGRRATIAWWFVPVMHLWKPRQVLGELFQSADPRRLDNWPTAPVPSVVTLWWRLWVTFQFALVLAIAADVWASTPQQMYLAAWGSAIVSVFAAPLGITVAIAAWRLRSLQCARARQTAPLRTQQPWPTRQARRAPA